MPVNLPNLFGLHQYDFKDRFFDGAPILSEVRFANNVL